jgi:peptidoglycan/LPS O-acetylase OafA/YrhL
MNFLFQPGIFRLALAVMVVASHMSGYEVGRPAVMAFFILSGYWVAKMYQEKYAGLPNGLAVFYLSRWLRIWPLYVVAVALAMLVMALTGNTGFTSTHFANLGLLGIASRDTDVLGVSWSLDIELQFYALLPFLLTLLGWAQRGIGRQALTGTVLMLLVGAGWYLQLTHNVWTVFSYLPVFVLGISLAQQPYKVSLPTAMASLVIFTSVGVLTWFAPMTHDFLLKDVATVIPEDWFGMAWVALLLPFIAYNVVQKSSALDRHFGNLSYALYLVHWPVITLMHQALPTQSGLVIKAVAFIISIIVSIALYWFVDRQLEKHRTRLSQLVASPPQGQAA